MSKQDDKQVFWMTIGAVLIAVCFIGIFVVGLLSAFRGNC